MPHRTGQLFTWFIFSLSKERPLHYIGSSNCSGTLGETQRAKSGKRRKLATNSLLPYANKYSLDLARPSRCGLREDGRRLGRPGD